MPQTCELELAAVTVKVVPAMLHAAAIAVVPWACAWHACQQEEEVSVAVHVVADAIVQLVEFPPRCWPFPQSASTSVCASGWRLPPLQFFAVATVPNRNNPGWPEV